MTHESGQPDPLNSMLAEAEGLFREGRLLEAEGIFRQILSHMPENMDVLDRLGVIAFQTQRKRLSVELFERLVAANPANPFAYNKLGFVLNDLKRHAEALGCFEKAIALDPSFQPAHVNIGCAYDDIAQWTLLHRRAQMFGVTPRLNPPVTFNERILHRIIFDRDPRLKTICNKLTMRDFVKGIVGSKYLVPILGVWRYSSEIPWPELPAQFVLKANHGCDFFRLVIQPDDAEKRRICEDADKWLSIDYFQKSLEWAYRGLERRLLAEPLLRPMNGEQLIEPQVFTFAGRAKLIRMYIGDKNTNSRAECWLDRNGRRLAIKRDAPEKFTPLSATARDELLGISEAVSKGFSSMRVDFFLTEQGLKIGELTPYTASGAVHWNPPSLDEILGRLWEPNVDTSHIPEYES